MFNSCIIIREMKTALMDQPTSPVPSIKTPVAIATGDGVGPEIMAAVVRILDAAGASIDWRPIEMGEAVYLSGKTSGITDESWRTLESTAVLLKSPTATPQGGGYKSLNVTLRKTLGLYANVRPCVAYTPFVRSAHPGMDVVVVRENEEDLYAGIEHRQTDDVYQCLKLVSRPGCERIVRYAFEYAKAHGRKRVTCMTKDNIMKLTDGLFHKVFDEIGAEYPEIAQDHMIIDIGMARAASTPGSFDVIVTPNLYGDILSDVLAEAAGSVGLAGSANVGTRCAMFEAIHGTAPDLAGKNLANPSGLLNAAVMMLGHIGQGEVGHRILAAWLRTLEDGIHTSDVFHPDLSAERVGTREFADAVIERLGEVPVHLKVPQFNAGIRRNLVPKPVSRAAHKVMVGVDVFFHWRGETAPLAGQLVALATEPFELQMITNRGVMVWPRGHADTFCTDHWRCRFMAKNGVIHNRDIVRLLESIADHGLDFVKTETLCTFDGVAGYSMGQGQ
jgi:isocitrate dehydrogenase